jgi:hypothetical protein
MWYEDAYARAYPFDKLVDGMLQPEMVLETVAIVKGAIEKGVLVNLIVNNRSGANASLIARGIFWETEIQDASPKEALGRLKKERELFLEEIRTSR